MRQQEQFTQFLEGKSEGIIIFYENHDKPDVDSLSNQSSVENSSILEI